MFVLTKELSEDFTECAEYVSVLRFCRPIKIGNIILQETSNLNTAKKSQCPLCNTQCSLWLNSKLIDSKH
jgi:hypothetical protein